MNSAFQANKYGLVCHMNAEQYPHIDVNLLSIYGIAFKFRNVNSQTNVKSDINYVIDNQNMQEHNNNKELGIFVFESDISVN